MPKQFRYRSKQADVVSLREYLEVIVTNQKADLLQGTLDMLILKALSLGPLHGYGVIQRLCQMSGEMLTVEQGALYPALSRIEQKGWVSSKWGVTETGRKAKFYALTRAGRRQLAVEEESWDLLALAIAKVRQAT
jgi:PadR family transcriptional regulator PadR